MTTSPPYVAVVVCDKLTVVVYELALAEDERKLRVRVDDTSFDDVYIRPWQVPRLSVGRGELLLWGGTRVYWLELKTGGIRRFDFDDEIHFAYQLPAYWCLVCETSVMLWTPDGGKVLSESCHDEILLETWWRENSLFVKDFRDRSFEIKINLSGPVVSLCPCQLT